MSDTPVTAAPPAVRHVAEVNAVVLERLASPRLLIPLPFATLHEYCDGGLALGELVYLGARPGAGKTVFAIECARFAARRQHKTLIVSREMTVEAVGERALVQHGRKLIPGRKAGHVSADHLAFLAQTASYMAAWPLWYSDKILTVAQLHQHLSTTTPPYQFVILDYLQLLHPSAKKSSKREEVEDISRGLMRVKLVDSVALLVLSSSTRGKEGMELLRESGELEHDADLVWILSQDEKTRTYECQIKKNRNGRTGVMELDFHGEFLGFDEATP